MSGKIPDDLKHLIAETRLLETYGEILETAKGKLTPIGLGAFNRFIDAWTSGEINEAARTNQPLALPKPKDLTELKEYDAGLVAAVLAISQIQYVRDPDKDLSQTIKPGSRPAIVRKMGNSGRMPKPEGSGT